MSDREKVIKGLECCIKRDPDDHTRCGECPYQSTMCGNRLKIEALALLKEQERAIKYQSDRLDELLDKQQPRVMTLAEVIALPYGYVLIETDKEGSLSFVDALLYCKNTNFSFDFITLEGRARLLGAEYNKEWRCWTSCPTDAQREAIPWKN